MRIWVVCKCNILGLFFLFEYIDEIGEGMVFLIGDNYDWVVFDVFFVIEIGG